MVKLRPRTLYSAGIYDSRFVSETEKIINDVTRRRFCCGRSVTETTDIVLNWCELQVYQI